VAEHSLVSCGTGTIVNAAVTTRSQSVIGGA